MSGTAPWRFVPRDEVRELKLHGVWVGTFVACLTDLGKEPSLLEGMCDWETSHGSWETLKCCGGVEKGG